MMRLPQASGADGMRPSSETPSSSSTATPPLLSLAGNQTAARRLSAADAALRRHFGHTKLRSFQRDALAAWAHGRDAFVTMATGAGKSLCFQLPPLCEPPGHFALVVSPLVALMQDQVQTLKQRQVPAGLCGSGASGAVAASWSQIEEGAFRVVYMCPEFIAGNLERLSKLAQRICLLAIDEAHCISSWGHDFRPAYRKLGSLRAALPGVPIMCLTATCPQRVREDVESSLRLGQGLLRIAGPMNRPNLKYVVRQRTTLQADLAELFKAAAEGDTVGIDARRRVRIDSSTVGPLASTVIYVSSKARAEEVASWLFQRGISAKAYHAGLGMAVRRSVQEAFVMDEVQVIVATIAFGMGIDKPSIRRVIHYGSVRTLEHYVQQCGRAGRDGEDSECITFLKADYDANESRQLILQDFGRQEAASGSHHCERMLALSTELMAYMVDRSQCRRLRLLSHFGERPVQWSTTCSQPAPVRGECAVVDGATAYCGWCDVCLERDSAAYQGNPAGLGNEADLTKECRMLLRCVDACGGFTGCAAPLAMVAGVTTNPHVKSKGLARHPSFGCGSSKSPRWWKDFFSHVRQAGFVQEKPAKLASGFSYVALSVSGEGRSLLASAEGDGAARRLVLKPVPQESPSCFGLRCCLGMKTMFLLHRENALYNHFASFLSPGLKTVCPRNMRLLQLRRMSANPR
eukprot:TRINITY_DN41749_c0_g1_i1.p1 TRINITY_DN41749_c0_g1~~TRINITY_DN41749_c0_g1_i1.p1  ORF type:complete len:689 (+),score=77.54 TRINITY_DN41749_c0_g1_i1:123-2189(+)